MKTHQTSPLFIYRRLPWVLAAALSLTLAGCGGGGDGAAGATVTASVPGPVGGSVLVATMAEPAGANCAAGGVRIKSGLDTNGNGVLDDGEVKDAVFACNGAPGAPGTSGTGIASLVRTGSEPTGVNCAAAGVRIQSGPDTNNNGTLEDGEVKDTVFACNGTAGTATAAAASLIRSSSEPAGANCAAGGVRIQSGQDASGNGVLEDSEVRFTNYACNGAAGAGGAVPGPTGPAGTPGAPGTPGATGTSGLNSLIATAAEGAGANCAAGGVRIQVGLDQNADGLLALSEVQSTSYVCGATAPVPPVARTWRTAQLIETDNAGNAGSPQIAIDASGNALAVWEQTDGTRFNVWANRYTAATNSWGTAALIETDNAGGVANPQIAMDISGNAIAVWEQSDGTRSNVWANRFTAATSSWGTAVLIENNSAGNAGAPQIAIDASGNAIAIFSQADGAQFNVYVNRYTAASNTWGTPSPENAAGGFAFNPQISIDASGNAMAVWQQTDGTTFNIWAKRYTVASGSWGTATLIETSNAGNASRPQIAVDASGNALAVWTQYDGTRDNIYANRYTAATTTWGTAAVIETGAANADRPQIAIDASGNALAVWTQTDGTNFNIWANRYTAATSSWGTAELIETGSAGEANRPQIAFDGNGNALAVWEYNDGARLNIYANRYTAATSSWGTAALIQTESIREGFDAQIAVNASGNALAVWSQYDGTRYNIVANSFR